MADSEYPPSDIKFDGPLAGTPFRGLIVRNPMCFCAYIGVPEDHWLANMEELHFDCHWGITFRANGGNGYWPSGWFWYGWDYAHAWDHIDFPPEVEAMLEALPFFKGEKRKKWTLEEIHQDLIDAAVNLLEMMAKVQEAADSVGPLKANKG